MIRCQHFPVRTATVWISSIISNTLCFAGKCSAEVQSSLNMLPASPWIGSNSRVYKTLGLANAFSKAGMLLIYNIKTRHQQAKAFRCRWMTREAEIIDGERCGHGSFSWQQIIGQPIIRDAFFIVALDLRAASLIADSLSCNPLFMNSLTISSQTLQWHTLLLRGRVCRL